MVNKKKSYILDLLTGALIFFTGLSYTEMPLMSGVLRYLFGFIIIIMVLPKVNFNNFKFLGWLILIEFIIPLILIIFGVYNYNTQQSIEYIFFTLFYLLIVICLSESYSNNLNRLIFIWQVSLSLLLFILFLRYRGISLNLNYLFNLIIKNKRYGSSLLVQRYGMGFKNVNTLGLFSILLIFCSLYNLYLRKNYLLSLMGIIGGIIFSLNSESRTPLTLILVLISCGLIIRIKNKNIRSFLQKLIYLLMIIISFIFVYFLISGNQSDLYNTINALSSYRLSFGRQAIEFLRNYGNIFWGIGPLNSTYITEEIFENNITLDNSIEFYMFTLGIIGMMTIYIFLYYLFYKINISMNKIGFVTMTFYIMFSFFENTIFLPVSAVSLFCLTIIVSVVKNEDIKKQ